MNVVVVLIALGVVIACARMVMHAAADRDAPEHGGDSRSIAASTLPPPESYPPTAQPRTERPEPTPAPLQRVEVLADVFVTPFQPAVVGPRHHVRPVDPTRPAAAAPSLASANPERLIQTEILVSTGRTATIRSWVRLVGGVAVLGIVWGLGVVFGFRGLVVFFKNL